MSRSYAVCYRTRNLLIFPSDEQRDTYTRTHMKFDPPIPITEQQAGAWKPTHSNCKKIAIWQEGGKWRIRGVFPKPAQQTPC